MEWEHLKAKFGAGEVPLPAFWGGYRVRPQTVEFWQGGPSRLHDRFEYSRQSDDSWVIERLAP
jgi:pyridoxamine 5'-phosphate oxidase